MPTHWLQVESWGAGFKSDETMSLSKTVKSFVSSKTVYRWEKRVILRTDLGYEDSLDCLCVLTDGFLVLPYMLQCQTQMVVTFIQL